MRDLDLSLGFNFSRMNSNGWNNFTVDDNSKSASVLPRYNPTQNTAYTHSMRLQTLLNEPPRPPASIYNCLESDQEEQGDIREVDYMQNEPEAKHVNSKQYFRMMKRRIQKVMKEYKRNQAMNSTKTNGDSPCSKTSETEEDRKKKNGYIYESRHLHAARRLRGKDGKFLATRPESQRFREKKKRGRKPKNKTTEFSTNILTQV